MNKFISHPIRKVLVPTDFSDAAKKAADYAATLSLSTGASIVLLHVNELPAMISNDEIMAVDYSVIDKDIIEKLELERIRIESEFKISNVVCHHILGFAISEIKGEVEKEKPDLVVMGTKGAHGIKELLFGSHTGKLIENCECPILAIPEKAIVNQPSRMAFATNFNDHELQALFLLVELMRPFHPEIMVLHVEENHQKHLEENKMEWFSKQVVSTLPYDRFSFHEIKGSSVELALQNFIDENKVDLIATAKRKRNFFDFFTSHSLTKELAYHSTIPLLAFHINTPSGTPLF